jgi:hypothetical protein
VLALILWLTFGWRVGVAEALIEATVGVLLITGGGGGRLKRTLRTLNRRRRTGAPALRHP